jgi:hypothetical protein
MGAEVKAMDMMDRIVEASEELNWICRIYDDYVEFETLSPAGEDVVFSADRDGDIVDKVIEYASEFDADEHAEMWIESRGKRGVPSSIRALIDDADAIQVMLDELAGKLAAIRRGHDG